MEHEQIALLNRGIVVDYLESTMKMLENVCALKGHDVSAEILETMYGLDVLIGESDCCVTSWRRVSKFYLQSACTLESATFFLNNEDKETVSDWSKSVMKSHTNMKPKVIESFADAQRNTIRELGFGIFQRKLI